MRALLAAVLLVALTLAGCADSGAPAKDDEQFDDVDVEVDEQTGAIRGVVVDESITPVAEAAVALTVGPDDVRETTSDEQGRFAFSKVPPGTYFLTVTHQLYEEVQTSTTVEAGVKEPPILKVQIQRLFQGEPYTSIIDFEGFFTCSQANFPGYLYSSSPCHANNWGGFVGGPSTDLDDYGIELDQERDFHSDVADGWKTLVFEMVWEPSAQGTSERMGIVVSTYKPERNTNHFFANVAGSSPMRFQIDQGEMHETSQEGDGPPGPIPDEGIQDMSYFVSVRPPDDATCFIWCVPPGLAFDQDFHVYLTQFYYLPSPEGWSLVAGDPLPF